MARGRRPNTTDLSRAGPHDAVTWVLLGCGMNLRRFGCERGSWEALGVESPPVQEPLCFLICLTSLMQAGHPGRRSRGLPRERSGCGAVACGLAAGGGV